jgi:hypothetical protein
MPQLRLWPAIALLVVAVGLFSGDAARTQAPKADPSKEPILKKGDPSKDLVVKYVTLEGKDLPLGDVLKKLKEQTDVEVRNASGDNPKLKLKLAKAPFWEALDQIAAAADLRVTLHQEGKIGLVAGPYVEVPTSYSGPFRVQVKQVTMIRKLEADAHFGLAQLEVAWQPPFQPFLVETKAGSVVVQDDQGRDVEAPRIDRVRSFVEGTNALDLQVPLPALPRKVQKMGVLKGTLNMIGSPKMLTMQFDKLEKGSEKSVEGVTAKLGNFETQGKPGEQLWTVTVSLKYPPAGPQFESFQVQTWLIRNEATLVHKDTKRRFGNNGGYEIDDPAANQAVVRYRFAEDEDEKLVLGKPSEWSLVYRTPGAVAEVPIPFEFKDVPLP